MRVVFAGTPEFSVPCLQALYEHNNVEVIGVYTQPDRPAGRGKKVQQSPVKTRAIATGTPVFQPTSLRHSDQYLQLQALDMDLMVVTAFGMILPAQVLALPRFGCVNIHASLLPKWRGAAPIQRAIEAGDQETGVALMQMEEGLDTGPVLASKSIPITPEDTAGTLHDKLSALGGKLLGESLDGIAARSFTPEDQDDGAASYARKLSKSESPLNWNDSAIQLERRIRAYHPWPMTHAQLGDLTIKIHTARTGTPETHKSDAAPGTVLGASRDGIIVATGDGCLCLERLQKPGGKPMTAGDFLNGVSILPGMIFAASDQS